MNNKTPSIISVIVTIILLVLTSIVILLSQLLAMNGYSERVGTISLVISLVCQVASIIVAAVLTSRLTRRFIEKSNWNRGLAGAVAVITACIVGGALMTIGLIISLFVAEGIR